MPVLEAYDTAARMKEVVGNVAAEVVQRMVPRPRYGTVTGIDSTTRRVTVTYPDEGVSVGLPANTMMPGVGATVRVSGYDGARYIDDVVSGPAVFSNDLDVVGTLRASQVIVGGTLDVAATVRAVSFEGDGSKLRNLNISMTNDGVLGIANGGTGGNTPTTARQSLGLASMSVTPVASTIVQRSPEGYVYGNYFNMTADTWSTPPARVAGSNGSDSFLRWYTAISGSMISGAIPNDALNGGSYQPANLHASVSLSTGGYVSAPHIRGGGNTTGGISGGYGAVLLDDGGNNYVHFDWNGSALVFYVDSTAVSYLTAGTFLSSAGTKTFVIDHPTDQDRYLVHACAEGPTTDVFYRGEAVTNYAGEAWVTLPDYFEALTTDDRTIQVTGTAGPAWVTSEIINGEFCVKSTPLSKVYWRVDAERNDARFSVAPLKSKTNVQGFGPYRFIN